jgi:tryptophan-rich sensory protein
MFPVSILASVCVCVVLSTRQIPHDPVRWNFNSQSRGQYITRIPQQIKIHILILMYSPMPSSSLTFVFKRDPVTNRHKTTQTPLLVYSMHRILCYMWCCLMFRCVSCCLVVMPRHFDASLTGIQPK